MNDPLAAIRAEYLRDLPARVAVVAAAVSRARESGAAPRDAAVEAHRIRGSAGTLGLCALSEAAGRVEDAIVDHDPVAWIDLEGALADLERAARDLTPPAAPG